MFYNYFLDLSKEEFTNDMIQLDKSNLDQGLPTATKLIHIVNKPAAQAAGADPSRCNSTNRQNQPIQQNGRNS